MHLPVLTRMIAAHTSAERQKLRQGLATIAAEDPTLSVQADAEGSQAVIGGLGELQLEIVCDRLAREFGVALTAGEPQVVYRETVTRAVDGEMKYSRQSDGRGHYAHVKIHLSPGAPGTGYVFENGIRDRSIPPEYIEPIDEGISGAFMRGMLAGHPVPDVRVELYGGSYHEVDSSDADFTIAAALALDEAVKKAEPMRLEPIMRVEVSVPNEFVSDVLANLVSRRGEIRSHEDRGGAHMVRALVPLSELFGYASDLRERTRGRGTHLMNFDRYEPVSGGADADGDRHSNVRAPLTPRPSPRSSAIALPEPGSWHQ